MFLCPYSSIHPPDSLPRVRGGVSDEFGKAVVRCPSSPRPRGCFSSLSAPVLFRPVFPASAGVFPIGKRAFCRAVCLPRVRGGVSTHRLRQADSTLSSPRPRGCFLVDEQHSGIGNVFPASAGVFLLISPPGGIAPRLPRVRGGVSLTVDDLGHTHQSSPRPRGCFQNQQPSPMPPMVFPASAGVFLVYLCASGQSRCLPRVRGGVSMFSAALSASLSSSPRPRGCFQRRTNYEAQQKVFPASAGVFPSTGAAFSTAVCLPRVRGGVSVHTLRRS